jgi:hypothetical protein
LRDKHVVVEWIEAIDPKDADVIKKKFPSMVMEKDFPSYKSDVEAAALLLPVPRSCEWRFISYAD